LNSQRIDLKAVLGILPGSNSPEGDLIPPALGNFVQVLIFKKQSTIVGLSYSIVYIK
jgi:hypothetical protein